MTMKIHQHSTPEGIAVNMQERVRLRAIREGKKHGRERYNTLAKVAEELPSVRYEEA